MKYGPARDSPNPLQRWAARGIFPAAVVFTLSLGTPMIVVLYLGGGLEQNWVAPGLLVGLFLFTLAAAWVRSPHVEDPGGEIVPYLPWFKVPSRKD